MSSLPCSPGSSSLTCPRSNFYWGNGMGSCLSRKCCQLERGPVYFPFIEASKESGAVLYFERFSLKKSVKRIEFKWNGRPKFADVADKIHMGSMVKCNWAGTGEYFAGVIANIRQDGTYDVNFDDFTLESATHVSSDVLIPLGVDVTIHEKTAFSETVTTYTGVQEVIKDWDKVYHKNRKATYHFKLCAKLDDGQVVSLFNIRQSKHIPMNVHTFMNELLAHAPVSDMYRKNFPCFADFASHTPPREEIEEDGWWRNLIRLVEELMSENLVPDSEDRPVRDDEFKWMQLESASYEGMR